MRARLLFCSFALAAGCGGDFNDDYNLVSGLRLLAVKAEPPEAAPGERIHLTALAHPSQQSNGAAPSIKWSACTQPPIAGSGTLNNDCLLNEAAPYLIPLGSGPAIEASIPGVVPDDFGPPDFTGGIYLPIRLRVQSANDALDGILRFRLAAGSPPNRNPVLTGILLSANGEGAPAPLDESAPPSVKVNDHLTLRAGFSLDSAEKYQAPDIGGGTREATETLNVTWFATAGHFSSGSNGPDIDTTLALDKNPPAAGATIDIWVIGRDERGGLDFIHRSLKVQ